MLAWPLGYLDVFLMGFTRTLCTNMFRRAPEANQGCVSLEHSTCKAKQRLCKFPATTATTKTSTTPPPSLCLADPGGPCDYMKALYIGVHPSGKPQTLKFPAVGEQLRFNVLGVHTNLKRGKLFWPTGS